ncbi:MAG: glutamate--cysteine ligase [Candidatus Polarisedimenticolaceae bacterium]|nr:glutamate--cysteine ligase [Candidatus Polarisedimenticolaceae bacterium]
MNHTFEKRLSCLQESSADYSIQGGLIGLEKEALRVTTAGTIAQTPHPASLGAALTHPYITTDYSEALTELITPPMRSGAEALDFLNDVQKFLYDQLQDELLWVGSMPCIVRGGAMVPIANYGRSNAGMMKSVYRRGLGHRYGRVMQVIAGIHFNYSLPESFWPGFQQMEGDERPLQDFISDRYFGMIRNLKRIGWLIPYLFGASPAFCKSFLNGQSTTLQEWDSRTYYSPYATSLRMADIGYQNSKEKDTGIKICYNNIAAYVETLSHAIETPCPEYAEIPMKVGDEYQQLNSNILQIENEYYSSVRPKQILQGLERPTHALKERGVRYVELRSLDINPFLPLGIDESQAHFIEALLITLQLQDSPPCSLEERSEQDHNEAEVTYQGRKPGLKLLRGGHEVPLREWATSMLQAMQPVCELLDDGLVDKPYQQSLKQQQERVDNPDATPSARVLAEMKANGENYYQFICRLSQQNIEHYQAQSLSVERLKLFHHAAERATLEQQQIEAADSISFEQFLKEYFG